MNNSKVDSPNPQKELALCLMRERPELRGRLHVWQVGVVDPGVTDLEAPPEGVTVHLVPPVPQREAIGYMLGADLLLLEEFESIMPSKALQYLRAARPLLALVDAGGVIRDLLQGMPDAHLVGRGDPARAGALIAALAAGPRPPRREPGDAVAAYSRREIARRYAAVLDAARERVVVPRPAASRPLDFGPEAEQRVLRSDE